MKHLLLFSFLANCLVLNAQSLTQQVTASGGGYYQQINASMQFTMGEPLAETYTNSSAKLYQGFEQGSYALVSVSEPSAFTDITVDLFPNPSSGIFNLNIKAEVSSPFHFVVMDAQGRAIISKEVFAAQQESINITDFASCIYFVTISNTENNYFKTHKIIKQ